jgi:hypothetical protein
VLSIVPGTPPSLTLLPAGAGQPRVLDRGPIDDYLYASFMPDGASVVLSGRTKSESRIYIQKLSAAPVATGPPGVRLAICSRPASPDGKRLAVVDSGGYPALLDVTNGSVRRIPGLEAYDSPVRWNGDGTRLFVVRTRGAQAEVRAVDPASGKVEERGTISPLEGTGVLGVADVMLTPDGTRYSAAYVRNLSTIVVGKGMF